MLDSPPHSGGCDVRLWFVSDTHIGLDWPARPRVVRRRRGDDFCQNLERALEPARTGEVDVVVHGGDRLYRSRVLAWLAETALAPLKRLASSGVPVLLVPGNHERGRIPYPLLAVHEGLHVFDRPRSVVLDAGGVRAAFIGFGDRSTCCRSQAGTDVDPSTRAARNILNSAGDNHSSLSARRRNSSGTERTTRNADP
jgi:calcineurin-like phosphoesterase family protein